MISKRQAHLYCIDDISKIENYNKAIADTTKRWVLHHRLEFTLDGDFVHTRDDLKRLNMYFDRPYFELIFLTNSEHSRLHRKGKPSPTEGKPGTFKGKHHSSETKQKLSDMFKGKDNPRFRKTHSEATKQKMSEARKEYWKRLKQVEVTCNDLI